VEPVRFVDEMAPPRLNTLVHFAGLLVGLGVAVLAVLGWRIEAESSPLGADLAVVAAPSGELELSPAGRFLSARSLTPGGQPARGELRVRNQTGRTLVVRPRALPSTRELDRVVVVELSAGARSLYRGWLGGLRRGSRRALRLRRGATAEVAMRAWLPRGSAPGWRGRIVDVEFELRGGVR
jgi:hypothetical protein